MPLTGETIASRFELQAEVRCRQVGASLFRARPAGERRPGQQAETPGQVLGGHPALAIAEEGEMAVGSPPNGDQVMDHPQGDVDPVLRAHEAEPAAEERSPPLQLRLRRLRAHLGEDGSVADHADRSPGQATSPVHRALQRAVHRDHVISSAKAAPFEPDQGAVDSAVAAPVTGFEQLRRQLALVEDEAPADELEGCPDREVDVGSAAHLDGVEWFREIDLDGEPGGHRE